MVREEVRATQYDNDTIDDQLEAHGMVTCRAELDDVPDVNLSFEFQSSVRDVVVHACAQGEDFEATNRLCFSPPNEPFTLLSYRVENFNTPPLRGFFQLKVGGGHVCVLSVADPRFI